MASCNSPRPEHAKRFGRVGIFHANGDVGEQLLLQAVAQVARGQPLAFAAGERRIVHGEDHGQRGLVDQQRLERRGMFGIGDGLADLNSLDAGDGHDVAGGNRFGFVALEAAEIEELGDARGLQRAVQLGDAHQFAAMQRALEDAGDGDAAEIVAVVEIGHLHLQHGLRDRPREAARRSRWSQTAASDRAESSPPDSRPARGAPRRFWRWCRAPGNRAGLRVASRSMKRS